MWNELRIKNKKKKNDRKSTDASLFVFFYIRINKKLTKRGWCSTCVSDEL